MTEAVSVAAGGFTGISVAYLTRGLIGRRGNRLTATGVYVAAGPSGASTAHSPEKREYQVTVSVLGEGARYHVGMHLLGADGGPDPRTVPMMRCKSPPLIGTFAVTTEQAKTAWCVVTWINDQQEGMRVRAVCTNLFGTELYWWRWRGGAGFRYWWQRKRGRYRPLGVWMPFEQELRPGQGPLDNPPIVAR
ncbi:MAG TPA: hypothetical protein VMU34_04715 [Mycobacterium sp.]|nr:hypothetical protein [Mycobacterium sp.]